MKYKVFTLGFIFCLFLVSCNPDVSALGTPITTGPTYGIPLSVTPSFTPPPTFQGTVLRPDYCYNGPSDNYPKSIEYIIAPDTNVIVLGKTGISGTVDSSDWFMIQLDTINRCWINTNSLDYKYVDLNRLLIFTTAHTTFTSACYAGPDEGYNIQTNVPANLRVVIYAKNNQSADWYSIVPHDSTNQCWIAISNIFLNGIDTSHLPIIYSSNPTLEDITLTPTFTPQINISQSYPPIKMRWKIVDYDCGDGRATGALIGLEVSGGTEPDYTFSPELPVYAGPGQVVTLKVSSKTTDGEPSNSISFTVPSANDRSFFQCDGSNTSPRSTSHPSTPNLPTNTPKPPPTLTPIPPTPTPPPTPTLCWPPGHCR